MASNQSALLTMTYVISDAKFLVFSSSTPNIFKDVKQLQSEIWLILLELPKIIFKCYKQNGVGKDYK